MMRCFYIEENNHKFGETVEQYKKQYDEISNILKDIDISKTRIELDKRCRAAKISNLLLCICIHISSTAS